MASRAVNLTPRPSRALTAGRRRARERRLGDYLLLPRPNDLVKAWILAVGFAIAVIARGEVTGAELTRALVVWFALELLVYQARYQWNDIRGFVADQRHPDHAARGRLPGPLAREREHKTASGTVIALRLAAALLLGVVFGATAAVVALGAAVGLSAVAYEALRTAATGKSDEVPPPLTPAIVAVWVFVGAGYAIRGGAGVALGAGLGDPALVAVAGVCLWCFGMAFVTVRWSLEALAFARTDGGREVRWDADAARAREHTMALARWLPGELSHGVRTASAWRPLSGPTPLVAPWNLAFVAACAAAAVAGALLVNAEGLLGFSGLALMAGLLGVLLGQTRRRLPLAAGGIFAIVALAVLADFPRSLLAAVPLAAICAAHLLFSAQSLDSLAHPLRGLVARSRHVA